jgi:hypothetical protein
VAQTAQRRRKRLIETAVGQAVGGVAPDRQLVTDALEKAGEGREKGGASWQLLHAFQSLERGDEGPLRALSARRSDPDESVRAAADLAEKLLQNVRPEEEGT